MSDFISGKFEWSAAKARRNLEEHGVSFEETTTTFADPLFVIYRSDEHSIDEHRYVIIGTSDQDRLLAVSFIERKRVRLISARKLTRRERRNYESQE